MNHAYPFWKKAVILHMQYPQLERKIIEAAPVCVKEINVKTVKDLERLCMDKQKVYLFVLQTLLGILNPIHTELTDAVNRVSKVLASNNEHERAFEMLKYGFKLLQERKPTWNEEYYRYSAMLRSACVDLYGAPRFHYKFNDLFDVLDMVTYEAPYAKTLDTIYDMSYVMQGVCVYVCYVGEQTG